MKKIKPHVIKPLDIVITKAGNYALVTIVCKDNGEVSLDFLHKHIKPGDYNAWHEQSELTYVCSIYQMITNAMNDHNM